MKDLFWKIKIKADENKNERNDIEKWEKKIKQKDLKFETIIYIYYYIIYIYIYIYIYIFDFQQFKTARYFADSIYNGKIYIKETVKKQTNQIENIADFSNKSRRRLKKDNDKKENTYYSINDFHEDWQLIINAFRSRVFSVKQIKGKGLTILTPKEMYQRLLIALAQVKAGNTSKNLLNEMRQSYIVCIEEEKLLKK